MKVAVHILHRFLVIASCHYALETVAFDGFVNIAGRVNIHSEVRIIGAFSFVVLVVIGILRYTFQRSYHVVQIGTTAVEIPITSFIYHPGYSHFGKYTSNSSQHRF